MQRSRRLAHAGGVAQRRRAHTFEVRATDTVGNVDGSPATRTFTVDTAGPPPSDRSITLDASKKKVKKGKKVTLSGVLDAPGDKACESNQTVQLQKGKTAADLKTFTSVQTNGEGAFSKKVKVKKTLLYRAVAPDAAACSDAQSGTKKVKAKRPR